MWYSKCGIVVLGIMEKCATNVQVFLQLLESIVFFGQLGLVFISSCFVFCILFLLFYVMSVPVRAEAAQCSYHILMSPVIYY